MKRKTAWLITWEPLRRGGVRDVVDGQVVAFLDHRLGVESVRQIMKALWIACGRHTWDERLEYATGKLKSSFFSRDLRGIYVGFNPGLYGRIVENLEVNSDDVGGHVAWIEVIYEKIDEVTGMPTVRRVKMKQARLPETV